MATASLQKQPGIGTAPVGFSPAVEIFASQRPFKIQQGKGKTIQLTGSVYNNVRFVGTITVEPNSPIGSTTNVACPILQAPFSMHVDLPPGANEVIISVPFFCPTSIATGTYNCALRYSAVPDGSKQNAAKGNEVDIGYNVIRPRRPGEPE